MVILHLENRLKQYFTRFQVPYQSKVVVAVSGGGDSVALALLLTKLLPKENITIVTIDHGLRLESALEASLVAAWSAKLDLRHHILLWRDHQLAGNLMENARNARYNMLGNFCRENKISHLFLGHTLDDQIETFFINLERGSGIDGLSAIDEFNVKDGINICRPLLGAGREELREFLRSANQEWIDDPSNENEDYLRVRIRKLFKDDQKFFERISLAISNVKRTRNFIRSFVDKTYEQLVSSSMAGIKTFSIEYFSELDEEIRIRLINKILEKISGDPRKKRLDSILRIDNLIITKEMKNHSLSGVGIAAKGKQIYFYPLMEGIDTIDLQAHKTFNFGKYQVQTGEIKDGYRLALPNKEQYVAFKKNKKAFPTNLPYNMILNMPVVLKLEKIVSIPHINDSGSDNLEICIIAK